MTLDEDYPISVIENMPAPPINTLGDIVRPIVTQPVAQLLTASGTPQQILANQFVAYASGLTVLAEALTAETKPFETMQNSLVRTPENKRK